MMNIYEHERKEAFALPRTKTIQVLEIIFFSCNIFNCHVNKTIQFMSAGINMFWDRLRVILARAVRRGLK